MNYRWNSYPEDDMEFILGKTLTDLTGLIGSKFLITGGTGFVGSWMLQFLTYASRELEIELEIDVITRQHINPIIGKYSKINFLQHDLRFPLPLNSRNYKYIMFASTPSKPITGGLDSSLVLESTKLGTKHLLDYLLTLEHGVKYLNTSSGALNSYKAKMFKFNMGINDVYAEAKFSAEKQLIQETKNSKISFKSPRLFSFAGPGIAVDAHFAVGNFMRDALNQRDVVIQGSPDTIRSYLHPIDMTIQLIKSWLGNEESEIFPEIGSFSPVSLFDLAQLISQTLGNGKVAVLNKNQIPSTYIPLNPSYPFNLQHINLEDSIKRWAKWLLLK